MRRLIVFTLALIVVMWTPVSNSGPTEVPFKGSFDGYLVAMIDIFTDPEFVNMRCNDPANPPPAGKQAWAVAIFEGTGKATHLGRTQFYAEHCSYAGQFGPDGTYGQGLLTFVAANGDVLEMTYDNGISLSPPPVIEFIEIVTFRDGGTGRFEFASGLAIDIGTFDVRDGSLRIDTVGRISFHR